MAALLTNHLRWSCSCVSMLFVCALLLLLISMPFPSACPCIFTKNNKYLLTREDYGLKLQVQDQGSDGSEKISSKLTNNDQQTLNHGHEHEHEHNYWFRRSSHITIRPNSRRRFLRGTGPGSSPPRCTSKCGKCKPCKPVHVPVPPGTPVTTEYYPEAWRCKCGNKLYMP